MSTQDLTIMKALVQKMGWLEQNQKVIAQNIANADTPGYRPNEMVALDFKKELGGLADGNLSLSPANGVSRPALALTRAGHMTIDGTSSGADNLKSEQQKKTYEVAPAGNAVDLEEQLLKTSENYADHRFITNLYQKNVDMLNLALKGPQQ
jgi:flagellar basal-body rod protein FlgB